MIRNIIFDWSGTLVDDLPAVLQASNFVLARAGKPEMSLAEFRAEFSLPFTKFYDRHAPEVPMAQLEEWFHSHYREIQDSVSALPHARKFLEFCRAKKLRAFILSSIQDEHFLVQCRVAGFSKFFDRAYTGVMDKRHKIHDILAENSLNPDETLFVGDMEHDIETARHGGVQSCAVLTGYNTLEQLRAAQPDLIVEHLSELRGLLERNHFELHPAVPPTETGFPIATVGALIFNSRNEVLLIRTHKWSNKWGIPGGKIKSGETSEAALRREILEETGLRISGIRFALVQDCIRSREFYKEAHFVLLNYTCRAAARNPKVILNEEGYDFQWLPLARAKRMKLNRPTRILINAVSKSKIVNHKS